MKDKEQRRKARTRRRAMRRMSKLAERYVSSLSLTPVWRGEGAVMKAQGNRGNGMKGMTDKKV